MTDIPLPLDGQKELSLARLIMGLAEEEDVKKRQMTAILAVQLLQEIMLGVANFCEGLSKAIKEAEEKYGNDKK